MIRTHWSAVEQMTSANSTEARVTPRIVFHVRRLAVAIALVLGLCPVASFAQTEFLVQAGTGRDDLRGGNAAFISLIRQNGSSTSEQVLERGFHSNSVAGVSVRFPETVLPHELRGFRIRHDGRPRADHPFDTYDNWDLRSLRLVRIFSAGGANVIYDSANDSRVGILVKRFTANTRDVTFVTSPSAGEPDFVVFGLSRLPDGIGVSVHNVGSSAGTVTRAECTAGGRSINFNPSITIAPDVTTVIRVGLTGVPAGTTVSCSISGVDLEGRAESVTRNNLRTQSVP